jgi:hypothetical protein
MFSVVLAAWSGLADKDFLWKFRHFEMIIYIKIQGYCSCLNGFRHSFVCGCSGTVRHVRCCFPRHLETPDINFLLRLVPEIFSTLAFGTRSVQCHRSQPLLNWSQDTSSASHRT